MSSVPDYLNHTPVRLRVCGRFPMRRRTVLPERVRRLDWPDACHDDQVNHAAGMSLAQMWPCSFEVLAALRGLGYVIETDGDRTGWNWPGRAGVGLMCIHWSANGAVPRSVGPAAATRLRGAAARVKALGHGRHGDGGEGLGGAELGVTSTGYVG